MSASASVPSGRKFPPPLDLRGGAPFGHTVLLATHSALRSLGTHKLRAALTIVGIVVGVAGVFVIVTFGLQVRFANARGIGGLGANVIDVAGFTVASTTPSTGGNGLLGGGGVAVHVSGAPSLTITDVQALQKLPHVVAVTPRTGNEMQVQAGDHNWTTQVSGAYPDIQVIQGYSIQQGAFFSQSDVSASKTVAVLGQTVAKQLFPSGNAVGEQVRIGSVDFTVVGVLKPLGSIGKEGLDDVVVVPASTFLQRLAGPGPARISKGGPPPDLKEGPPPGVVHIEAQGIQNPALDRANFDDVQVAVDDPNNITTVQSAITRALEQNHGIPSGGKDDFTVGGFLQGVETAQQGAATILWTMGAIASVALLIGGFGVANVMLATVAERRREIGVRLAVGASIEDIFWQFLLEALTLSVAGGLLGLLLSSLLFVLPRLSDPSARIQAPPWLAIVAALIAPVLLGLIFGVYPARRAAQTDPIEALSRA